MAEPKVRLLLLSNSTTFGGTYLGHARGPITDLFGKVKRIAFVPFALQDQQGYFGRARAHFETLGIETERVLEGTAGRTLVESTAGIFIGGGNTFRLLDRLQRSSLLEPIRARVLRTRIDCVMVHGVARRRRGLPRPRLCAKMVQRVTPAEVPWSRVTPKHGCCCPPG